MALPPSDGARASTRLKQLIHRKGQVLSVMHPPTAALARIMERAGCEALFVGTSAVVGGYTGLADVGTASMTECVQIAGWIASSVATPVIIDGDTGHGGIMAVRRLVRDCIHAGIAGIRIDDQPIEGKRRTQSAGLEVVPLEQAIVRYRAAVDMKNELDPDFVVMAQCYARDAANGGLDESLRRLAAYHSEAGVDWVQLEVAAFHRGDQAGAPGSHVPHILHEGQAPALSLAGRAPGAWRHDRVVAKFLAPRDLGGIVRLHGRFPSARPRCMGGLRRASQGSSIHHP